MFNTWTIHQGRVFVEWRTAWLSATLISCSFSIWSKFTIKFVPIGSLRPNSKNSQNDVLKLDMNTQSLVEIEEVLLSLRDPLPPLCPRSPGHSRVVWLHRSYSPLNYWSLLVPLYLQPRACGKWRLAESEINSICCASLTAPNAKVQVAQ